jgi:hypothetical protein
VVKLDIVMCFVYRLTLRGVLDFPCSWHTLAGRGLVATSSLHPIDSIDTTLANTRFVLQVEPLNSGKAVSSLACRLRCINSAQLCDLGDRVWSIELVEGESWGVCSSNFSEEVVSSDVLKALSLETHVD